MSAGLLLVTHGNIGAALLAVATRMLGTCPLAAHALAVHDECNAERLVDLARRWVRALDSGGGVLVLTDLYGSTPANIAARLQDLPGVRAIAGVNLPMLVRVLNYPDLPLDALADKAVGGARDGIMQCRGPESGAADPAEACKH
jgi:PTS system mannose-specific IIA component